MEKEYSVSLYFEASVIKNVCASNKEEAIKKALEMCKVEIAKIYESTGIEFYDASQGGICPEHTILND